MSILSRSLDSIYIYHMMSIHVLQGILRMSTLPKFMLDLMHLGNEDMIANPSTQCVGLAYMVKTQVKGLITQ